MPQVRFTYAVQRHVPCPPRAVAGSTVREALDTYFADNERARSYFLDERGAMRHHVVVFVDGHSVADRTGLTDPVAVDGVIDVMQALSGG